MNDAPIVSLGNLAISYQLQRKRGWSVRNDGRGSAIRIMPNDYRTDSGLAVVTSRDRDRKPSKSQQQTRLTIDTSHESTQSFKRCYSVRTDTPVEAVLARPPICVPRCYLSRNDGPYRRLEVAEQQ